MEVMLTDENFGPPTIWHKNSQLFSSANIRELNVYRKHKTKFEIVAKIQDTQVAKLWSNDQVQYNRNFQIP